MPKPDGNLGEDCWTGLSWDDLGIWVGARSLTRGRTYQRQGRVIELACSPEGRLSGRVEGTEVYTTVVARDASGALSGTCSCPVGYNCKHAAAVVLEYLERLKTGEEVAAELSPAPVQGSPGGPPLGAVEVDVEEYLAGLSATELAALVGDLMALSEQARKLVFTRARLAAGETAAIVAGVREEIRRAAAQPGWRNHWDSRGYTPDYSLVTTYLQHLVSIGECDLVLELGRELLAAGGEQVEMSDDEGETGEAVSAAFEPVWAALTGSSLTPVERLLWLYDRHLEDDYGLLYQDEEEGISQVGPTVWSEVADGLRARLEAMNPPADVPSVWPTDWRRNRLSDWVIDALQQAGRDDEAVDLAVREAKLTASYGRAVDLLMESERWQEARSLALEGIEPSATGHTAAPSQLRERLREITAREGDSALAAAFAADDFFVHPNLGRYQQLRADCRRAGVWDQVRPQVLASIGTGELPFPSEDWPLPDTGTRPAVPARSIFDSRLGLLIEIALDEGDIAEALRLYNSHPDRHREWAGTSTAERLARAAAPEHPDEAIRIWRALADREIARVNRAGYEASLSYLRPIRRLLSETGREEEWDAYLQDLRQEYSRRPALIETLEVLDDTPIIEP